MFTIQFLDHEEGSAARWNDMPSLRFETKEKAREFLKRTLSGRSEEEYGLYSYRIVEVGSRQYYSHPTDKLEY